MISIFLLIVTMCGLSSAFAAPSLDEANESRSLVARANKVKVITKCSVAGTFALTFDDGPYSFGTSLVKTLNQNKAKGTFFVNGNNYDCIYKYADSLLDRFKQGHLLANHGWSHAHMGDATYAQANDQVKRVEDAFIKILGVKPLYFRAPYGEYNDNVLRVLADRGYRGMILWSADSHDADDSPPSASKIIKLFKKLPAKTISLSHETQELTVKDVMPKAIPALKERGLKLVTVAQCLGASSNPEKWYAHVGAPGKRDSSWTCEGAPAPGEF